MSTALSIAKVRSLLIRTAKGEQLGKRLGLISYKELWLFVSKEPWGQYKTQHIVRCISRITAHELAAGRPPLNELVVPTDKLEPTEPWQNIKRTHQRELGIKILYSSHREAQEACWKYWGSVEPRRGKKLTTGDGLTEVEEGLLQDQARTFRTRNRRIVEARKEKDKYQCQVCKFKLRVNGRYIIDCHHKNPLGLRSDVNVTRIEDLICLCPTCHRIAHTKRYPLAPQEIAHMRGI